MEKIEIEVPNGKVANITKDNDKVIVTFKEKSILDQLKDIDSVKEYIKDLVRSDCGWAYNLWREYKTTEADSYSEKICLYRMVVAALTNNEECYLTTGERWFPVVQFCKPGKESNCWGNKIIGFINSNGMNYTVVGGIANYGGYAGLGCFDSVCGVATSYSYFGFRSVSSKEIAKHISTYFGKLLFDIHYGGINCNWKWIIL